MKLVLVAPGYKPFPPQGWGAVESIVWDYYQNLKKRNIDVHIVNTANPSQMISECNAHSADIVHIMYDDHIVIVPYLQCQKIYYTSHYAYLTHPMFSTHYPWYFHNIFQKVLDFQDRIEIHAISEQIAIVYREHGFRNSIRVVRNGAREDCFRFVATPAYPHKSVYVAKVEFRKGQYLYQSIKNIDFVGNYHDSPFDTLATNYLGEWDKPTLYKNLTDYGNLVLLSDGEADPLVIKEALIAGLGVVVSECATANLDLSKPYITVVPNEKRTDIDYVKRAILQNRIQSLKHRSEIRDYGLATFAWEKVIDKYIEMISI
jgi:glycosyltransferase involved in cell wall biosynthesis